MISACNNLDSTDSGWTDSLFPTAGTADPLPHVAVEVKAKRHWLLDEAGSETTTQPICSDGIDLSGILQVDLARSVGDFSISLAHPGLPVVCPLERPPDMVNSGPPYAGDSGLENFNAAVNRGNARRIAQSWRVLLKSLPDLQDWTAGHDRFLRVLSSLRSAKQAGEPEEEAESSPDLVPSTIPQRRVLATMPVDLDLDSLPRRKPQIAFVDDIEDDES